MKKEMICIACPLGCRLAAEWDDSYTQVVITGNQCARGEEYGREEILSPSRIVTATVAVSDSLEHRVSVKSTAPVPRDMIDELLDTLYAIRLIPPVTVGQAVVNDYSSSGIDIVTTRSVGENK